MKLAYLILAHVDPHHIARLAKKLMDVNADIYIHVDSKVDIDPFVELLSEYSSIYFINNRHSISWGGYSSINATITLIKEAFNKKKYDRYILLQGLDYPLVSIEKINTFFRDNAEIEYIRGCKITGSKDRYHNRKYSSYWFMDNKTLFKKFVNRIQYYLPFKLKDGVVRDREEYNIYWGSAQWALTSQCIEYILNFSELHNKFNNYFKYVFAPDESYFHTIIFNSSFSKKTMCNGPELAVKGLVNWRNLHYFEYDKYIKIFTESDFDNLINSDCLFFRKATTLDSTILLNKIDNYTYN
ncbi:beta-1,6-N-acetylglucosaminyltransferase [Paenibacillus sp. YAF4_2]|uniref:beta-1,6-N-acetylglucosaminyltransferase n=1 Tax=Paenibacillus sp. YAF4_2 TaxID=3233085 RepID=UPI003F945BE8